MKTITEFPGVTIKNAAKVKQDLLASGKTPEELAQSMGESLKLEGEKLTWLMNAVEIVGNKQNDLKRVLVFALNEGEKQPTVAKQKDDKFYQAEYYAPVGGPRPGERDRDDRGRGGRGGKHGDKRGGKRGDKRGDKRGERRDERRAGPTGGERPASGDAAQAAGPRQPREARPPRGPRPPRQPRPPVAAATGPRELPKPRPKAEVASAQPATENPAVENATPGTEGSSEQK